MKRNNRLPLHRIISQGKMTSKIKNITVYFLILNLVISTMGLTVHVLYCLCKGEQEVSIFNIEDDCAELEKKSATSCCHKGVCSAPAEVKGVEKNHNCAGKSQTFVKLDTEMVVSEQALELHPPQPMVSHDHTAVVILSAQPAFQFHFNKAPPPRPGGQTLLPLIQSYLC